MKHCFTNVPTKQIRCLFKRKTTFSRDAANDDQHAKLKTRKPQFVGEPPPPKNLMKKRASFDRKREVPHADKGAETTNHEKSSFS